MEASRRVIYFANPSTPEIRQAMRDGLLDCMTTPGQGNKIPEGAWWCADNGCFGKNYPGDDEWWRWVQTKGPRDRCRFVVAPDVVGDAAATMQRSLPWLPKIRELGVPAAFVAQDGLEYLAVPWEEFDVLFIGGTTDWKLGAAVRVLVAEAKRRGKWVHMGRVNSGRRMRHAQVIGCDSSDGTYLSFGPEANLPTLAGWLRHAAHPTLFTIEGTS